MPLARLLHAPEWLGKLCARPDRLLRRRDCVANSLLLHVLQHAFETNGHLRGELSLSLRVAKAHACMRACRAAALREDWVDSCVALIQVVLGWVPGLANAPSSSARRHVRSCADNPTSLSSSSRHTDQKTSQTRWEHGEGDHITATRRSVALGVILLVASWRCLLRTPPATTARHTRHP